MDDTFMLITAWVQTDPRQDIETRLRSAYGHVGVSITITSLTNLLSFLMGAVTPFPAISIFCLYMSFSLVLCYFFQITLFGGFLVIFARFEERGRHSLFFWTDVVMEEQAKDKSKLFRLMMTASSDKERQDTAITRFFRDKLGEWMTRPGVKSIVLLVFTAYLAVSIVGITNISTGMDIKDLVRTDSYAHDMFQVMRDYFTKYQIRYQIVLNETMDFADPNVQREVENMLQKFESIPNAADSSVTWSWLRMYKRFQTDYRTKDLLFGYNMTKKEEFIKGLRDVFFRFPVGRLFEKDVLFNENFTEIRTTRYFMLIYELKDSTAEKNLYKDLSTIKNSLPFSVATYNQFFPYFYQYTIITPSTVTSLSVATLILLITIFIFIPNFACALAVTFSVISVEIGVMGFMSFWNVSLNGIVMMSLVTCVGLSVDYAAHVSYAYISSTEKDPNKRLINSIYCTGTPIVQSSLSTLLSIVLVFFLPSRTFLSPAKNIFLLIIFAVYHSIFLLPILLSLGTTILEKVTKENKSDSSKCTIRSIDGSITDIYKEKDLNAHAYINQNFSDSNSVIVIRL
ncbi:daf-6 [Cordylochernes scorpioides]|uniref:Daf-6 n=1 Tax=Cordylochernes scorpioides TaxID=51811 RepID=A0ABY6K1P4_9ARAC|nr:daf-6 [Cordylochernes scorpioides]